MKTEKALFIFISCLIHLIVLFVSGLLTGRANPISKILKKKQRVVYVKILDVPKPKRPEKPVDKNTPIISQYTMRKKGPLGKQEKSMLSGSSPVMKPRWGAPFEVLPAPVVAKNKQTKAKQTKHAKKRAGKGSKVNKNRVGKKNAGPTKSAKAAVKKKKVSPKTKVELKQKLVRVPLPPIPKRKLPLIDPRLISRESRKIVPQMGQGESVEISLDTTASKYISYFKHIRDKIYLVWRYPPEAAMAGISGVVRILFVISRDGHLKEVRVLESSGYSILDKAAVNAIIAAAPFGPFPKDWEEKELRIRARFIYTLYRKSPF